MTDPKYAKYNATAKGKARHRKYDQERRAGGDVRPSGKPSRSKRYSGPLHDFAARLGVTAAVARDILEARNEKDPGGR